MKSIVVKDISKTFKRRVEKRQTTFSILLSLLSYKKEEEPVHILKNISFDLHKGDYVGIIGKNGSGKSTLLRIIAGIIEPESGVVETNGKIIPIINLHQGIKGRLTVRDNIHLSGSYFGLTQREIKDKLNSILEFSELKKFADTKWYQLSDGMKQRIAFSIAIHSEPEILLSDEATAVGDSVFRKKCQNELEKLNKKGVTILFTSHNLENLSGSMIKIIWIDRGEIVMQGDAQKVIGAYLKNAKR